MTPKKRASPAADWWSVWFWRLIQVTGAGIIVEQVVVGQHDHYDRPWILLSATGMIIGAKGIELALRAILRIGGSE